MKTSGMGYFQNRGFTLIELLVVMSVVALTVAIAAPNIADWAPAYSLKGDLRSVASLMQSARLEAIRRNQAINMEFTAPGTCTMYIDANANNSNDDGAANIINIYPFNRRIIFGSGLSGVPDPIDFPGDNVIFNPDGTANNGNLYLQFDPAEVSCSIKEMSISVGISGNVTLRKWDPVTAAWLNL